MNVLSATAITASALEAEKMRVDITSQNIANAHTTQGLDGKPYQRRVVAFEGGTALAVGHQGSILLSADHGRNWRPVYREAGLYLRAISFASDKVGWAVGHEGRILHTRDGLASAELCHRAEQAAPRVYRRHLCGCQRERL